MLRDAALSPEQQQQIRQLTTSLQQELRPLAASQAWLAAVDSPERDEQLRQWDDLGRQFSSRCRELAEELARASHHAPVASDELRSRPR
ncbi:MAG: hypothetical protein U0872_00760 [Planctomycetaceae bacterium]